MRYIPRSATAASPNGWLTRDDAVAAIRRLANEDPLPLIPAPDPMADYRDRRLERTFKDAYRDHPVVVEAREWMHAEARDERTFVVLHYLAYLPVIAARRYVAAHPWPAPGTDAAPPPPPF